jgi:hypothetical protein
VLGPQQEEAAVLAGALGAQHEALACALAASGAQHAEPGRGWVSLKTGMLSSVWNCSHGVPCGSVTQYFSLRA